MSRLLLDDAALDSLDRFVQPGRPQEALVELACRRIGHVGPNERFLLLNESDLNLLERRLGAPVIGTPQSLYQAVDKLTDIKIGNVSLDFTPEQYQEIQRRSQNEGCTPVEYIRRICRAMHGYFFTTAPADPLIVRKAS